MIANVKLSLLVGLLSAVVVVTAVGCPGDAGTGEGEGDDDDDDDDDDGGEGEGDVAGEGEGEVAGEGEGEGPPPAPGTCTSDAQCTPTQTCRTIFQVPPGQAPPPSACFNTCMTVGDACTTTINTAGSCTAIAADANICIGGDSGNLGPCGNAANAGCSMETAGCATGPGQNVGVCIIPCDAADMCMNGLVCSKSPIALQGAGGTTGGVCAPQSAEGDVCGPTATGVAVCSVGQVCNAENGMAGTCAPM
jgi:hypothetical protein